MHGLCVLLLLEAAVPGSSSEAARAVIDKAIQAQGGVDALIRSQVQRGRLKGTFSDDAHAYIADFHAASATKYAITFRFKTDVTRQLCVFNGDRGWLRFDGITSPLDSEMLAKMKHSAYVDHLTSLVPLVREKGLTLTLLKESQVEGKPAAVVQVATRDKPSVSLYFDKTTGLLVKSSCLAAEGPGGEHVCHDIVYRDYQLEDGGSGDVRRLEEAKRGVDGPALLAALRGSIPDPATHAKIQELVTKLADPIYSVRQQASADLARHGLRAMSLLRQARESSDGETMRRAGKILDQLGGEVALVRATIRLLAMRKPAGAAAALVAYLPWAPDDTVVREVMEALLMLHDPARPDPALSVALKDERRVVRRAAAAVLGTDGGEFLKQPRRLHIPGLRLPARTTFYRDGRKHMETHTLEREFFSHFPEALFQRPLQDPSP